MDGACVMYATRRRSAGAPAGSPSTRTSPLSTIWTPTIARITVVLPLPLGPSRPVTFRAATLAESPGSATLSPRTTRRSRISIAATHADYASVGGDPDLQPRARRGSRLAGARARRGARRVRRVRAWRVDDASEGLRPRVSAGRLPRDACARRRARAAEVGDVVPRKSRARAADGDGARAAVGCVERDAR